MRYTELPWPFDGWTVDDEGTIHTACGYRTNPQRIEAFEWLMRMHEFSKSMGGNHIMYNESSIEEKRPIFDWKDTLLETKRPNDITLQTRRSKGRKKSTPRLGA